MHALVIEDELIIASELQYLLEEMGFSSIALATTEDEAVNSAQEKLPLLILSDVHLRIGEGPNAIARIREFAASPFTVIYITATGHILKKTKEMALVKPIDELQLRSMIVRAGLLEH